MATKQSQNSLGRSTLRGEQLSDLRNANNRYLINYNENRSSQLRYRNNRQEQIN